MNISTLEQVNALIEQKDAIIKMSKRNTSIQIQHIREGLDRIQEKNAEIARLKEVIGAAYYAPNFDTMTEILHEEMER